ncbi:glycosyltransferase [Clostridium lacusfryxellense]|uniref:glycosyltransferase n=1 Tax=Clostridium lacusfryxellense TaxID=205328 RepID=UPI001C0B3245|nr:glycosyltransferase [Clostridium lacusfryxellense]MBU3110761.1 glycosyltransferase [Clostridium lacusfryxellense]
MINTLKELTKSRKDLAIDLFLFSHEGELMSQIPQKVKVIKGNYCLNLIGNSFTNVVNTKNIVKIFVRIFMMILVRFIGSERFYDLIFLMGKKFDRYDIAISYFNDVSPNLYFNRGCNQFVANFIDANQKIAWIHTDPDNAKLNKEVCLKTYFKFDHIVVVSKACKSKLDKIVPEFKDKISVVYNLFPIKEILKKSRVYGVGYSKGKINIVTVARIDNSTKRIDRIIEVCSLFKTNNISNYKWYIVGDGPDLNINITLAKEKGLIEFIEFIGNKKNPYPYIANADLFVLTSDYEGYPMVVGESLILKTPVITTNYIAAQEQIKNNYNGLIVEMSVDELYSAMYSLITDYNKINKLKNNLTYSKFSNEVALFQINSLLKEVNNE